MTTVMKEYLNSPKVRYAKPETKYRYLRCVKAFLSYSGGSLDKDTLLKYLLSISDQSRSSSYPRWVYQVLKGFYDVIGKTWPIHPKELPSRGEPERPYLELDESDKLLGLSKSSPVDYAMFRLVLVTGIRKRELRELNLDDYNSPRLRIDTRKHGEVRIRTLDVETLRALDDYISGPRRLWETKNKHNGDQPLFLSPTGNRMPDSTLTSRFARYMRAIGKPKGTGMHSLRRTVVTWEAEGGMTELEIQKLHGWKSSQMPGIYARLKPSKLEEESNRVNPLVGGEGKARKN